MNKIFQKLVIVTVSLAVGAFFGYVAGQHILAKSVKSYLQECIDNDAKISVTQKALQGNKISELWVDAATKLQEELDDL